MSELFNIGLSFKLPTSQDYSSSQNLVLVNSASPKLSSKITARTENLIAIHKKILLHLRNERTLTVFELRKLLAILKRTDCSSSQDKKIAQSAHDIIIKCVNSQTFKNKDRYLPRNIPNTTSDSSTADEHQSPGNESDDSDAKQVESEAEYTTDNSLQYTFTEYAATSHQTEREQYMDSRSQGTSDDIDGQQLSFDANSKTSDDSDNYLKYKLTQNVPMAYQTELDQYMDPRSQSTSDDIDGQQLSIDANSKTSDNCDNNWLKYKFTQNDPKAYQNELKQYMDQRLKSTSDDIDGQKLSIDANSKTSDNSDNNWLKYKFTQNDPKACQNELKQYMDPISKSTSDDIDGQKLSIDANSKTSDNSDNDCLEDKFTQSVSMAYQTEQYMEPRSQDTSDHIQKLSFDENSYKPDHSDNCLKYPFTQNAPMAHQTGLKQYTNPKSQGMSDDIDGKKMSFDASKNRCTTISKLQDAFPNNAEEYLQTTSNQHLNVISNIFSSEEMLSSNDSNITPIGTNLAVSEAFLKRHEVSLNSNIDNERIGNERDNVLTESFSVPPLLENRHSDDNQQSNVLKLRLGDVKFDSDTVSIPIELLTNYNFGSHEGQCQNKRTPTVTSDYREKNYTRSVNTPSNQNNFLKSSFTSITHHLHQNQFLLTPSSLNNSIESSVNTNNIEWMNSKLVNKQIEKVSCAITSKSNIDISDISSFSRNTETPILNIEMDATNSEEPNLNKNDGNFKGTLSMSADVELGVQAPSLPLQVYRLSNNNQPTPRKNISNVTGAIINGEHFEYARCTPQILDVHATNYAPLNSIATYDNADNFDNASNATKTNKDLMNVWHTPLYTSDFKNKNRNTEAADLTECNSVPVEEAMDICNSWMEEQIDLEMTENEKRYVEMAANSAETETKNFIFDQNKIRNVMSETNVDDSEQESFVFNLDADYSSDLIEGTPFENPRKIPFPKKIKTILPKNVTRIPPKSPRVISETLDIIIDETPCRESQDESPCINDESPEIVRHHISPLKKPIVPRDQPSFSKQHKLSNPYKKWPRSNTFQEMFKSNYQRKSPGIERGKVKLIKNIKVNDEEKEENISQSQSFGVFISGDQTNNFLDRPTTTEWGDSTSSERLPNVSGANNNRSSTLNNPSKNEPTTSKNQETIQSENVVFIDGTIANVPEDIDIAQAELEEEEELFEENARKLEEKIEQKRNKYKEVWNSKLVNEKVSLKYVRKFGVNIFEDPVSSLLNIGYKANVNNFYFPRLTKKELNEKLTKSSEQAKILNEALTKMIDLQISSSTSEDYQFKIARNTADSDDSSDEDEQIKDKRMLEEIKIKSRLEMKEFMEDMERERKEEIRLKKETGLMEPHDDVERIEGEHSTEEAEQPRKLVELLRKTVDCSWLK